MMNNKTNIEELTTENRRIVEAVAKQYKDRGLTIEQLIAEGNKGLVKAAERFDPSKGLKFMSYAVWWIRQSIPEALAATENGEPLDQWHPVLTARERGILRDIAAGESLEQIAEERRLTVERVRQIRELAQRKLNESIIRIRTMSKNKDQKRKAQLATRAKNESFRFQVDYMRKQRGIDITGMEQALDAELDTICQNGLTDDLFTLAKIVEGVQQELGFEQEADLCSLNGSLVPYILGITKACPDSASHVPGLLATQKPLQVVIAYDNEIRNRVVDWVKAHHEGVKTRLGQPILKLQNMVVEFKRVVKA